MDNKILRQTNDLYTIFVDYKIILFLIIWNRKFHDSKTMQTTFQRVGSNI